MQYVTAEKKLKVTRTVKDGDKEFEKDYDIVREYQKFENLQDAAQIMGGEENVVSLLNGVVKQKSATAVGVFAKSEKAKTLSDEDFETGCQKVSKDYVPNTRNEISNATAADVGRSIMEFISGGGVVDQGKLAELLAAARA